MSKRGKLPPGSFAFWNKDDHRGPHQVLAATGREGIVLVTCDCCSHHREDHWHCMLGDIPPGEALDLALALLAEVSP